MAVPRGAPRDRSLLNLTDSFAMPSSAATVTCEALSSGPSNA